MRGRLCFPGNDAVGRGGAVLSCRPGGGGRLRFVRAAHRSHPAELVGFGFEGVVLDDGDSAAEGVGYSTSALLDDMGEFVAEEELSMRSVGVVLAGREV